ncbi:MAG TPA: phage holin family protein [Planktothrix sp.]|jgi:uncharacterized membrane protein YvlD (DUF360 family)
MTRFFIRLALIACAFYFVFPMIPGLAYHGTFVHALVAGLVFAVLGWVVETIAVAVTALLAIGTLGLGLLVLIPIWLLGFWILPAVALKWTADFMPATLAISGWTPAILGGLVMLLIGVVTSTPSKKDAAVV